MLTYVINVRSRYCTVKRDSSDSERDLRLKSAWNPKQEGLEKVRLSCIETAACMCMFFVTRHLISADLKKSSPFWLTIRE